MSTSTDPLQSPGVNRIPFSTRDEANIHSLSTWMMLFAGINIIAGVYNIGIQIYEQEYNIPGIVAALVSIILGVWSIQASGAFRQVALTDKADQAYLVAAFSKLRLLFFVQGILIIISLLIPVVAFLGLLINQLMNRNAV